MTGTDQKKPSVIANLMGLDDMPPQQQPVYRRQRVLSENYLRKLALIVSREKSSSKARQNSRVVSKKANSIINYSCKDSSLRYIGQKSGEKRTLEKGIEERNDSFESLNSPRKLVVLRPNIGNVRYGSKPLFLSDSNANLAWEFKKQLLERSKTSKVCQLSMPNPESKRRAELGWKDDSIGKLPIFKRFNFSFNPDRKLKKTFKVDVKSSNNVPSCGDVMIKRICEPIVCEDSVKEGCSSCSSDFSFEQDSSREDEFISSNSMEIDYEFSKSSGEAYQPSPDSVLGPQGDNSSSSEYGESVSPDLHGLWMKLQILKSESEENRSKPKIVTSSDEDTTERSSFCTDQNPNPISCFGPKKTQEFSYLINVLEELGFNSNNTEPECMINPSIFETLEKKYEKPESWTKTDRRVLFDRINFGISEILEPRVNSFVFLKPLRRRISDTFMRGIVEEELWRLLVHQEMDVNVDLSEKAVGREPWLEVADEVDSIVREIEGYLFDELVMELIKI